MSKIKYIKTIYKYQELVRTKELLERDLERSFKNIYGELSVEDLPINRYSKVIILRTLRYKNINTVSELLDFGINKLYFIRNFGGLSIADLEDSLNKLATFKMFGRNNE